MSANSVACNVCGSQFSPEFSYQTEQVGPDQPNGTRTVAYFCSQQCLERSHQATPSGSVCGACGKSFSLELASQVFFAAGRRHYACSPECRTLLLQLAHRVASAPEVPLVARGCDVRLSLATDGSEPEPVVAQAEPPRPEIEDQTPAPASGIAPLIPLAAGKPGSASPVSWQRIEAALSGPPQVLAIFNHKGGTGKTTTAVTLAAALASRGKQVLLVDTDGQGNVATSLGLTPTRTLYHVLVMGQPFASAVLSPRPGLDVLAANETLAAAELYLAGRAQRDRILATRLASCRDSYEHVIIDCSPSLSLMSQNTLVFADAVLCPVACDYLSLVGVRQVLRTIKQVNRVLGHPVRLWGVLPTMFDTRARVCREALDALREHFKDRCLDPIHTNIKAKEAPAQGETLLEYSPEARCTVDYLRVVDRLLNERREQSAEPNLRQLGGIG
jgi:chromosome partitioning protein